MERVRPDHREERRKGSVTGSFIRFRHSFFFLICGRSLFFPPSTPLPSLSLAFAPGGVRAGGEDEEGSEGLESDPTSGRYERRVIRRGKDRPLLTVTRRLSFFLHSLRVADGSRRRYATE